MILTGVEFKFLNYQLNDNRTFSQKTIIAKSKYIFYGPVQATSFSCKNAQKFDENAQKPFGIHKNSQKQ